MFNIYMKGFNQNGRIINEETLVQTIPAEHEGDLKLISPVVKGEMGNAEAFNFNIENGTKFYDAFRQMKTYIRVEYDGTTIFYGRVLTIDEGFYGTRKVRCEGPLSFLLDSVVEGTDEENRKKISTGTYLENLINTHNSILENDPNRSFTLGNVPGHYGLGMAEEQKIKDDSRKFGAEGWTDTKAAIEDLRSHYGGYLRARLTGGIGSPIYLDWMNHYFNPSINTQTIEVGKNVIDLNTSMEIDNVFTAIVPIGNNHSSKGAKHFYIDGKVLRVPDICSKYGEALNSGYHRYEDYATAIARYGLIIKAVSFDDAENKEQLYEKACEWIKNNYQGEVIKFTAKAVDLHQIGDSSVNKILVGDRVKIIYPSGSESGESEKKSINLTCMSIQYDLYNPENNQYAFGIPANIMTKSYGLNRQSKSTTSGSTSGRSSAAMDTRSTERDWLDIVRDWLIHHMIYYRTNKPNVHYPFREGVDNSFMHGPYGGASYHRNYFYSTEEVTATGNYTLWFASPVSPQMDSTYQQEAYDNMWRNGNHEGAETYKRAHMLSSSWKVTLMNIQEFNADVLMESNLINYIKDEYGIDVRTGLAVKMPERLVTSGGTVYNTEYVEGEPVTRDVIEKNGQYTTFTYNGKEWASFTDKDGNIHYYMFNEKGEGIETDLRTFTTDTIKTNTEVGSLIIETLEETDPFVYHMTLSIERFLAAQLVTARVEGDTVILGNLDDPEHHGTSQQIRAAVENISDVCGDFSVETDPLTGKRTLVIKDGTGMAMTRDGAQFGVFDDGNLTGGIIVRKVNDSTTQTTIRGDRVDITANSHFVNLSVNVNGIEQTVIKHSEDLIDQRDDIRAMGGQIQLIQGSALWTQRDTITGTVGQFEVITDSQGKKSIVVVSGGGMKIRENGVEYGVYSSYSLTGGIIADKLNDGTVVTKVSGDVVDVTANQVARLGFIKNNELTAGFLVDRINGDETAVIRGDRISIEGRTTINDIITVTGTSVGMHGTMRFYDSKGYTSRFVSIGSGRVGADTLRIWETADSGRQYDVTFDTLAGMVKEVSKSTDGLTLTLKRFDGSTVDFSKATTLSGSWSGDIFTVTASPQNKNYNIGFGGLYGTHSMDMLIKNGTPSFGNSSTDVKVPLEIRQMTSASEQSSILRISRDIHADVSGLLQTKSITGNGTYTPDENKIGFSSITVSVTHSPTATSPVAAASEPPSETYESLGDISPDSVAKWYTQTVKCGSSSSKNYKFQVKTSVQFKEVTSNGTYYPDTGYLGLSGIKVSVPSSTHSPTATSPVAAASEPPSETYESLGDISPDSVAKWYTQTVKCGSSSSKNYKFQVKTSVQFKEVTSNGTYYPDTGYLGLSGVKVSVAELTGYEEKGGSNPGDKYPYIGDITSTTVDRWIAIMAGEAIVGRARVMKASGGSSYPTEKTVYRVLADYSGGQPTTGTGTLYYKTQSGSYTAAKSGVYWFYSSSDLGINTNGGSRTVHY